jgi:hypothetical protein
LNSTTATAADMAVSFKTYNPINPEKFELSIFVEYDSNNGYTYNFKPQTGKTKNEPRSTESYQSSKTVVLRYYERPYLHDIPSHIPSIIAVGYELLGMDTVMKGTEPEH